MGTSLTSICLIALALGAYALSPSTVNSSTALRLVIALLLVTGAIAFALRSVLRSPYPILRAVEMLTAVVSVSIVGFASVYLVMSTADGNAFSEPLGHTAALYFAMTTATTIGFGDITPKTNSARTIVMVQMATNVLVIGVAARAMLRAAKHRSHAN